MTSTDFIVIGAGIAGSSTAWRLAQAGHSVTVLERTTPANAEGSSHGSARIFRYAYPNALYAGLVKRAKGSWDELEAASGKKLLNITGSVDFGELRNPRHISKILDEIGVENEVWSAAEARERFPQVAFDTEVLYHPGAGVLDAQETVNTMLELAVATGNAQVEHNWEVASVTREKGGFVVRSSDGRSASGAKVIVAAGAWLPFLSESLSLPDAVLAAFPQLEVREEQAFHLPWRDADENGQPFPAWPTFIQKAPHAETYGLPGGRDAGFTGQKMAFYSAGKQRPSALDRDGVVDPEMRERIVAYTKKYLPGAVPEPFAETTCMFTKTVSEDFIIDDIDGVVILSACSGHGGKFAPLLGELAAEVITGSTSVPEEFRLASHARAAQA